MSEGPATLRNREGKGVLEVQHHVLNLVQEVLGGELLMGSRAQPDWLQHPGKDECGDRWELLCLIYDEITEGLSLPEFDRESRSRTVDAIHVAGGERRVVEVDEAQHFTLFRAMTLRRYPADVHLAFDRQRWLLESEKPRKLKGGNFAKPVPLFRIPEGRHRQRAFRDTLADLLPLDRGFLPTLRIAEFEVSQWLDSPSAGDRMALMIAEKLDCGAFHD